MKFISNLIVLMLFVSCSNKDFTLEEYANYPVEFSKQKVEYPNKDFSMFIPKDWEWKVEDYESESVLLGIDAWSNPDKDGFVNVISIQKIKSFGGNKDLKSEFEYCKNLIEQRFQKGTIIKMGPTEVLQQTSYFLHTKSNTDTYGALEIVTFIIESETAGVFYNLTASVARTEDLEKNMSIILQSLQTFRRQNE